MHLPLLDMARLGKEGNAPMRILSLFFVFADLFAPVKIAKSIKKVEKGK